MSTERQAQNDLSTRLRERLEFIEFRLYWEGSINRHDLAERFGISKPQATLDLKHYQTIAPSNLTYDLRKRCYSPSEGFSPLLAIPSAQDYLNLLDNETTRRTHALGFSPAVAHLPSFKRSVSPEILHEILHTLRRKERLEIEYQSPKSPDSTRRWVYPLVLVHALGRWHLRTYCHLRHGFRSFVLGRILAVRSRAAEHKKIPKDIHWEEKVRIVFTPSKTLSRKAASIIAQDYDMKKGRAAVSVRRALLEYFLLENGLLNSKTAEPGENARIREENGQVAIDNVEAVKRELRSLRKEPTQV